MPVYIFSNNFKTKPDRLIKEPLTFIFLCLMTAMYVFAIYVFIDNCQYLHRLLFVRI